MECFEFGYVIKGDVNDTLKKTVEYCSDGIKQKAKVLAGYIQSDDFLEFCKKDKKFDSTKSILENKQNTVRRILKQYYELKHQDVTTAAAKRQADLLMGLYKTPTAPAFSACCNTSDLPIDAVIRIAGFLSSISSLQMA